MSWTARSLLPVLGLALTLAPACKKDSESAPPTDEAGDSGDDADDSAGGDDGSDADAEEPLTQAVFEEQVQGYMDDVVDCYSQASAENAELAGQIVVNFTIGADGSVESAVIDEGSSLNDETMNTCLQGKFSGWTFAKPASGESTVLIFPFNLAPA
ncbi:MAG: AgmX/PglI C-terminal domain-containing protein [Myxococcales bacterium]|nr:AgmX/PglI C-terminal domain-containing protein [Myxococcales bacterium]